MIAATRESRSESSIILAPWMQIGVLREGWRIRQYRGSLRLKGVCTEEKKIANGFLPSPYFLSLEKIELSSADDKEGYNDDRLRPPPALTHGGEESDVRWMD